jgi:regulator of sigma E protease
MEFLLVRLAPVLSFIVVLGLLVFVHEFGHFMAAKRVGIKVEEFALGMGPRFFGRQVGETMYSLRVLPLGGFCKMSGEDAYSEAKEGHQPEAKEAGRQFFAKSVPQRALVIAAGPLMNLILAGLVYGLIFGLFGIPVNWVEGAVIGDVSPGTPAAEAGLLPGDHVKEMNGKSIHTWEEMAKFIEDHPSQQVRLTIQRPGQDKPLMITVVPQRLTRADHPKGVGFIGGVRKSTKAVKVGFWKALGLGFVQMWNVLLAMITGLVQLVTGKVQGPITGPLGIARMTGQAARYGLSSLLELTSFLSINLGLINLLPVPALDGGRLVFLGVEAVRRKPVNPEKEGFVHFIGFALLMLFLAVITLKDLQRLLSPLVR